MLTKESIDVVLGRILRYTVDGSAIRRLAQEIEKHQFNDLDPKVTENLYTIADLLDFTKDFE